MIRTAMMTSVVLALVAACQPPEDQDGATQLQADTPPIQAPAMPVEPAPAPETQARRATIDWNTARTDYAAAQAVNPDAGVEIASGSDAPPVPVLLPGNAVSAASGAEGLQFRPLNDGYFAVIKGETYDMLINGTDRLAPAPPGAATMQDGTARFEETMTGAQVSFKRYGASYLVEFACKDPATAARGACVTEEEALVAIEDMLIAGTR